jgi:hypothetical protein
MEEIGEEHWKLNVAYEFIEPNGYLYIIQRYVPRGHRDNEHDKDAYECKSLATGELVQLFPHEITTGSKQ